MTKRDLTSRVRDHIERELIPTTQGAVQRSFDNPVMRAIRENLLRRMHVQGMFESSGREEMTGLVPVCMFFKDCCNLQVHPIVEQLFHIGSHAGWFFPSKSVCWIVDRPEQFHQDEEGRLHSENGPALSYADGFEVYAFHGVVVDREVIMNPHGISIESIVDEPNLEVRHVRIQRYGYEQLLRDSHSRMVHEDSYGKLWDVYLQGSHREDYVKLLEVINATAEKDGYRKHYFIRVPPWTKTAKEGVAWTFGMAPETYNPIVQS
jgi:hypothetical protein